jgi:putative ABC transport system permease protein
LLQVIFLQNAQPKWPLRKRWCFKVVPLTYIFKEILAEKTRFFLIILALSWGTASVASMLAIGEGLRLMFGNAMANAGKNIMIIQAGQTSLNFQGQALNQRIQLKKDDFDVLQKGFPAAIIAPEYSDAKGKLLYRDKNSSGNINGVGPAFGKIRYVEVEKGGRFINAYDVKNQRHVIVLGRERSKELFGDSTNPLHQKVYYRGVPFEVIGVMKKKIQINTYEMPDDYLAFIPSSTYITFNGSQAINYIVMLPSSSAETGIFKKQVRTLIAMNKQVNPEDKSILVFTDAGKIQQKAESFFRGMEIFLGVVGSLTLIVACVGIANVMFMTVRQLTREIGIRMAVGARTYHILAHYMLSTLIATAIGGSIGFLMAEGIVSLVNHLPLKSDIVQYVGRPSPVLSMLVIFIVILILGVAGMAAAWLPAKKAANIDPAQALRYE